MEKIQKYHHIYSQVRLLYDQSIVTFLFPIFITPLVCALLWEVSDHTRLLTWAGVVIIYSIVRYLILWQVKKTAVNSKNVNKRLELFITGVFLSGILWGVAAILLVPYEPDRMIEFTIYNSLTMLVVCGLVAGAVVNYSVNKWVIAFYSFPALVPPAIYLVSLGDKYNSALGGFILLYFIFVTASSFRLNRQYNYYIDIEYQMIELTRKYDALMQSIDNNKTTD